MGKNKNKKTDGTDIIVAGGGVAGLALAALLAGAGIRAAVIDPHPPAKTDGAKADGRTSALMHGSVNILKRTGAWERCAARGEELRTLRIIDDGGKAPVQADFHAEEIGLAAFGVNMPNAALRAALGELVPVMRGAVRGFETGDSGVTVFLDSGQTLHGKLLVGAEGRRSAVREGAGIACRRHDYGQKAITCLFGHERPHEFTSTEFHRASGPFTMVPLPGNRSSLVWVDFDREADAFAALSPAAFARAVQERTGGRLGKIDVLTAPEAWPLQSLKAARLTARRVALIAEAAHVVHPLGAQGLNLSLRDAAALAETVTDALRLGLDPGSAAVLGLYERRRTADIASRVAGTDGLNRLVSNGSKFVAAVRRAGLGAVGGVSVLREFAMQQGLAPALDQSRLAAGHPL